MSRLLIAGYGFLGQALEGIFAKAGWYVDTLSRSVGDITCDLGDAESVQALPGGYDVVIHCASSGGGGEDKYRAVYLNGVFHLIERFSDAHILFTSSTSVYGQKDHSEVSEDSLAEPGTAKGMILREAEDAVLAARGTVARLSGLYGPGRCHVLKNLLAGVACIDGSGERIMNFIHRDDVASALLLLVEKADKTRGEVFNITAEPVSQLVCYQSLAMHFGVPMPESVDSNAPRKRGNTSKRVGNKKLRELGWQPRYAEFLEMAKACEVV